MASELRIEPIPAFEDNYIWLLTREGHDGCTVVDPGDDDPVREVLNARDLRLDTILVTHKHGDHVGGIAGLKGDWPEAVVYGPTNEPIRSVERHLRGGEIVELEGLDLSLDVLDVPGHTEGHIAYYTPGALFCGDTLFACGCGRVFSGTFEQLAESLRSLAELPVDTRVYCAHEYTLDNIGFAKWVEPENPDLLVREERVRELRQAGRPSVPSTLGEELLTNPFMRTDQPEVIAAAEHWAGRSLASPTEVFTALRTWKDKEYD
ncbi:MAG: hydroxyacylglutathione hydrolase [Gammaproteobacteria bacterium]|nr:MAG: hydroxyacylglutathione hydrolase [Gammaproteobacteria bacterium]